MIKAENCIYNNECVDLYGGDISIDFDNKAVFIDCENKKHMFDGWVDDIEITLTRKNKNLNSCSDSAIVSALVHSTTLIIKQGDQIFTKNLDDLAYSPLVKGAELSGFKWTTAKDLSQRSIVISANQ